MIVYLSSTVLTFFLIIIVHLVIPIITLVIYKHDMNNRLEEERFKNTYGTFLDGLSQKGIIGKYWNIMVLIRWSIVSVILVSLRDNSNA